MMSFPKLLLLGSLAVFSVIGVAHYAKRSANKEPTVVATPTLVPAVVVERKAPTVVVEQPPVSLEPAPKKGGVDAFIDIDRVHQLFTTGPSKLPIVETISYSSKVSWLKGRPAWIADYASYYRTSRHFIARSLNGKVDYFTQKVMSGSRFNVFKKDKKIDFHLLIDASHCKMALYYFDHDTNERILLKTYTVGLGQNGLTPVGDFSLGSKVAIYKPGTMGYFHDKKIEMIRVFGTRWIPFDGTKGCGIHGVPWTEKEGKLTENKGYLGKYASDGSVQMTASDMEELFAVVITKPAFVHIVKDIHDAKLPGIEVATPTR